MLSMMSTPKQLSWHMAHGKNWSKSSGMRWKNNVAPNLDVQCDNYQRLGHVKADCWSKGGGKEGQGQGHRKSRRSKSQLNLPLLQIVNQLTKISLCLPVPPTSQLLLMPLLSLNPNLVHVLTAEQVVTTATTSQISSIIEKSMVDRKSTRLNSSHRIASRMPSSA